jgi:hypothetical protein
MNIKPFTQALRDIHSAVNLSDRVGSLQLYGAATAIYRDVLQVVNAEPEADRAANQQRIGSPPHGAVSNARLRLTKWTEM